MKAVLVGGNRGDEETLAPPLPSVSKPDKEPEVKMVGRQMRDKVVGTAGQANEDAFLEKAP